MVSTPGVPFNNLFCLQVLLRWALVSAAAILLAACLFSCWIGISILFADSVSMVDTLPSCVWMMTVPAVLACMATNLGRKMWSALWVSSHSLLPQFAYLAVMPRGCALLSNPATNRSRNNALFWCCLEKSLRRRCVMLPCVTCCVCLCMNFCWCQQLSV